MANVLTLRGRHLGAPSQGKDPRVVPGLVELEVLFATGEQVLAARCRPA